MSRLGEVYDEGSRRWAVARAALVLVGSLVAVVGFVAATASLVAGFGLGKASALKVATLLGGGLLVGAFLVLFARGQTTGPSRLLASVGATFAVVGLVLFWTTLPAGWTGHLSGLPPLAVGTFAVGLLAVFAAGFAGDSDADGESAGTAASDSTIGASVADSSADTSVSKSSAGASISESSAGASDSDSLGRVEQMVPGQRGRDAPSPSSAVGDGGEDEDDLQFFDDEDS